MKLYQRCFGGCWEAFVGLLESLRRPKQASLDSKSVMHSVLNVLDNNPFQHFASRSHFGRCRGLRGLYSVRVGVSSSRLWEPLEGYCDTNSALGHGGDMDNATDGSSEDQS